MDRKIDNKDINTTGLSLGDEELFLQLYEIHWECLFIYVCSILKDKDEAGDIVQEVFISLWQSRDRLDDIRDVKSYLWKMARNGTLQKLLSDKKRNNCIDSFAHFSTEHQPSPAQEYDTKELASHIDQQIAHLPDKMREVFVLSRQAGLSNKEIAQQLDLSENTIKKQINNSIKRIKASVIHLLPTLLFMVTQA